VDEIVTFLHAVTGGEQGDGDRAHGRQGGSQGGMAASNG
jgi:hypothetical protein